MCFAHKTQHIQSLSSCFCILSISNPISFNRDLSSEKVKLLFSASSIRRHSFLSRSETQARHRVIIAKKRVISRGHTYLYHILFGACFPLFWREYYSPIGQSPGYAKRERFTILPWLDHTQSGSEDNAGRLETVKIPT